MKMNLFVMTSPGKNNITEYVIAGQDFNGRRFKLDSSLLTNETQTDREVRDVQNRRILRMLQAIAYGQAINLENWTQIEPAYGSPAFNKLDAVQRNAITQQHVEAYSI
jgi:hypothetical protein